MDGGVVSSRALKQAGKTDQVVIFMQRIFAVGAGSRHVDDTEHATTLGMCRKQFPTHCLACSTGHGIDSLSIPLVAWHWSVR